MDMHIVDLDTSLDLDRTALLAITGAEQYIKTVNLRSSAWRNTSSKTYDKKSSYRDGWGGIFGKKKTKVTTYRKQYQTRAQNRYKLYRVGVTF